MELPAIPQPRIPTGVVGPAAPRRPAAFDLKGTMAPLTVLRPRSTDFGLIERQLRVKIAQLPHMFLHAPVLLDFGALEEAGPLTLEELVRILRVCKMVPVAATNVPPMLRDAVIFLGPGILQAMPGPRPRAADPDKTPLPERPIPIPAAARRPTPEPPPAPAPAASPVAAYGGPLVVNQPVRSGQVVYAQNNDLVVLAQVNAGAQVIADGHVHIYAPLRGRAVAGAKGLPGARIFCQKLEAELVAISGAYVMAEEIPAKMRGGAVQISLVDGKCRLQAL